MAEPGRDVMQSHGVKRKPSPAPDETRRRAARACNACRALKERCQGGFPCQRCLRLGRECETSSPSAAPRTNGDGARVSRAPSQGVASTARTVYLEQIAEHFLGKVSLDEMNLRMIVERIRTGRPEQETPSSGKQPDESENLEIEEEDYSSVNLSSNVTHYSGEFSHWNFSQKLRRRINEQLRSGHYGDTNEGLRVNDYWRPKQLQSPPHVIHNAVRCLPPSPISDFLIRTFFKYVEPNYFFVEAAWLRSKLQICHEQPGTLVTDDSSWVCAVIMVLAVGTQYTHMEAGPSNIGPDDIQDTGEVSPDDDLGRTFYHAASTLLPDVLTSASVESVQACLLLAQYALPLDTHGLAYTYLSLTMSLAIQNGLHRKSSRSSLGQYALETRNRLWWTAYTIEKRICILHGRPVPISHSEVDARLPEDIVEFHDSQLYSSVANMSAMISLTLRLGEIAHRINLLRKCPRSLQSGYFKNFLEVREHMNQWWSNLEDSECKDLNPARPSFRANIHLKMCYHLNQIYMGRPFLFYDSKNTPSPQTTATPGRTTTRSVLVTDCIDGAVEIIKLAQLLHDQTGLARASYIEFSSCRAALLAIVAQSLNEWCGSLRNSLAQGMRLIKTMALGCESTRSEFSVIEALETAIRRLDARGAAEAKARGSVSGYDSYKHWMLLRKDSSAEPRSTSEISPQPVQSIESGGMGPEGSNGTTPNMPGFDIGDFLCTFPYEADDFLTLTALNDEWNGLQPMQ